MQRLVQLALDLFEVICQPRQHRRQPPGTLTGFDQRAVETSERRALPCQTAGQPKALGQRPAHTDQYRLQRRLAQLPLQRGERIDQRNTGASQGCQLAGQLAQLSPAEALATGATGRVVMALEVFGEQPLLAQQLPRMALAVGLQSGGVAIAGTGADASVGVRKASSSATKLSGSIGLLI